VNRTMKIALVTMLAAVLLAGAGCIKRVPIDPASLKLTESSYSVDLGKAKDIYLHVAMDAGKLRLESTPTTTTAFSGSFSHAESSAPPELSDELVGSTRQIDVTSPKPMHLDMIPGRIRNEWNLVVAQGVPVKMNVELGAGSGVLDLTGIDLTGLSVSQGAGDSTIDLSEQTKTVDVHAALGAGNMTIKVPANVRVRIVGASDGVGSIKAPGFVSDDSDLANATYLDSADDPLITIDVERGVGDLRVVEIK
jgi:hypothetical protein